MSFANSTFLWGLLALSIPIIVHLFNFRKVKVVQFSNVRFLHQVQKKSSNKLQLKQLLVLLCRLLFIAFLVLAFAQPFLPGEEKGLDSSSVIIYLDNSGSMSNLGDENAPTLSSAQSIATEIINLYPSATKFKILDNDFDPQSYHFKSSQKATDIVAALDYSPTTRSGQEIFDKISGLKAEQSMTDIFIISDMQKSTLGMMDNPTDSSSRYYIIPLSPRQFNNLSVDTAYLNHPFILAHNENILTTRIKNSGNERVEELIVKLQLNGIQSASVAIDVDAHSTKTISFELGSQLDKYNEGKISFEDFPVTFDNDFYLSFNLANKIKITEVKNESVKTYIQKVYEDNPLFDFHSFHHGEIDYEVLENTDLLVAHSLENINSSLQAQIQTLLTAGKSVLLFPHPTTLLDDLKGKLLSYEPTAKDSLNAIKKPDLENPFFEGIFESMDQGTEMPTADPLFKLSGIHTPLLESKTGIDILTKVAPAGNLYVASTDLSAASTNLYRHAFFVPIMQRIAELSASAANRLYYTTDENNVTLTLDSVNHQTLYELKPYTETKPPLIPSQRLIQNQLVMDFPKYLLQSGNYELTLDSKNLGFVSFNSPKAESSLQAMEADEYKALFSGLKNLESFDQIDSQKLGQTMKEKYHSIELWKYALLLSVLFLIAESVLLRFL